MNTIRDTRVIVAYCSPSRNANLFEERKGEDQTQLLATFRVTELAGLVSLMYGMLLHSGAPARGDNPPPQLPQHTLDVALLGLKMLNHIAVLDLKLLQVRTLFNLF